MFVGFLPSGANCSSNYINASANFDFKIHLMNLPYSLLSLKIEQNITAAIRSRELEEGFVRGLSIFNYVTTVSMFLCGIGICYQIWKRRGTAEITPYSFLLGLLSGSCWCVYGILKQHPVILYVNVTQLAIYTAYTAFYWAMSRKKCGISAQILVTLLLITFLINLLHIFGCSLITPFWRTSPLGIVCAAINVVQFAAPFAMLKFVVRQGNTSVLPFPLCAGNLLVSTEWFLYGALINDVNIIIPNSLGLLLATAQLFLFLILPRKPKQRAPLIRFCSHVQTFCWWCQKQHSDDSNEDKQSAVFWDSKVYDGQENENASKRDVFEGNLMI